MVRPPVTIIFASEKWQPATSRDISLPKLLEWEGNGLTLFSKGFVSADKSVSHPPIRSVRFVQVEPRVRVTKQIESAMGKMALSIANSKQE
mgnify:CR=1 FL=1